MPPFYFSLGVFGVMEFMGDIYPRLIANGLCFHLLGCNIGFFGYDGLVHLVSGLCIGLGLLWFKRHDPKEFALWTLSVALAWEASEWVFDTFRMSVLHMNLFIPENIMTQPTTLDTIGDMVLGCLGTAIIYAAYRWRRHS
jgi:hypothetical protein